MGRFLRFTGFSLVFIVAGVLAFLLNLATYNEAGGYGFAVIAIVIGLVIAFLSRDKSPPKSSAGTTNLSAMLLAYQVDSTGKVEMLKEHPWIVVGIVIMLVGGIAFFMWGRKRAADRREAANAKIGKPPPSSGWTP